MQVPFTHICPVDLSILINWNGPFPIFRVSGVLFHFYFICIRNSCEQTVWTLIRRRVLVIWVCTVCLGPKKGRLGKYGLNSCSFLCLSFKIFFDFGRCVGMITRDRKISSLPGHYGVTDEVLLAETT